MVDRYTREKQGNNKRRKHGGNGFIYLFLVLLSHVEPTLRSERESFPSWYLPLQRFFAENADWKLLLLSKFSLPI